MIKYLLKKLENYFGFKTLGSTWKIEILAGLSTFLSLSYIFVVNPSILSEAGIKVWLSLPQFLFLLWLPSSWDFGPINPFPLLQDLR